MFYDEVELMEIVVKFLSINVPKKFLLNKHIHSSINKHSKTTSPISSETSDTPALELQKICGAIRPEQNTRPMLHS